MDLNWNQLTGRHACCGCVLAFGARLVLAEGCAAARRLTHSAAGAGMAELDSTYRCKMLDFSSDGLRCHSNGAGELFVDCHGRAHDSGALQSSAVSTSSEFASEDQRRARPASHASARPRRRTGPTSTNDHFYKYMALQRYRWAASSCSAAWFVAALSTCSQIRLSATL